MRAEVLRFRNNRRLWLPSEQAHVHHQVFEFFDACFRTAQRTLRPEANSFAARQHVGLIVTGDSTNHMWAAVLKSYRVAHCSRVE